VEDLFEAQFITELLFLDHLLAKFEFLLLSLVLLVHVLRLKSILVLDKLLELVFTFEFVVLASLEASRLRKLQEFFEVLGPILHDLEQAKPILVEFIWVDKEAFFFALLGVGRRDGRVWL
jgi:hypothetical protein